MFAVFPIYYCVLNPLSEIVLATVGDSAACFAGPFPTFDLSLDSLQFFVDGEEVLNFAPGMREHLIDGVNALKARIAVGYGEDLLIALGVIEHLQHADRPCFHHAAGKARLVYQDDDVEGIAILGERTGDEAVVAGVVKGRI